MQHQQCVANYAYKESSGTSGIFERAEVKYANKTSSLNTVAKVK